MGCRAVGGEFSVELEEKLRILGAAARFDVTCSSRNTRGMGAWLERNQPGLPGIYYTWSEGGRCLPVLKVLFSNRCVYDCAYCVNRASASRARASFTPEEVADITLGYYRRGLVRGLFLSSSVWVSPDHTMERLVLTARKLRLERGFRGYIHLKVIPGASSELVREAALYADRLSVNIELPTEESLRLLAPDKRLEDILTPMEDIGRQLEAHGGEGENPPRGRAFLPAGQTTQLIVGATPENDLQIMRLAEELYRNYGLRRVYYSAFFPVSDDSRLPPLRQPPLLREHRLYQADWLIRRYGFEAGELLEADHPDLDEDLDPKTSWALRNLHYFPIEVNSAEYPELIRVPGIGLKTARRIVAARRCHSLDLPALSRLGVIVSRARHFITCKGRYYGDPRLDEKSMRCQMHSVLRPNTRRSNDTRQLSLLDWTEETRSPHVESAAARPPELRSTIEPTEIYSTVTGEL